MAYFVEHAQSGVNAAITAIAQNVPAHQANDILIAHITVDSGTITVSGSSWAALPSAPSNPVTQGTVSYLLYVKAAGSTETLTLTTADAYTCGIYCYRDVDGTTPFDGVTPLHAGVSGATTTPVNSTISTNTADDLVIFHIAQDGTTPQVLSDPGVMSIYNADSTGTTATTSSHQSAAWYIQRTAGTTPAANWSSSVSGAYVRITFALKNASGGAIPAYIDDVSSPGTRLTCGHHVATQNNISYSASGSYVVTANISGKTLTQVSAANGADFGINPYCNAVNSTAAATAKTALTGPELVLTSGRDLSTGLICGSFIAGTPKMGSFGIGTIDQGGVVVRVASGANNWNAYQVVAKNSIPNPVQRCVFAIQAGYAGSDYDTGSSGSATTTSVTYIQLLRNAPSFSSTVYMSELHQVQTQIVAGGDTNNPVDTDGMAEVGQSFRLPVIQKVGSAGLLSFVPIQIGGGDSVNFQIDAGALQFPRRADTTKKELQYHAADNTLGISYAGKSGDVVKHTNSVITSPTPYYWEINSAATSAATWDFTGLVIVGANVTLRNVMTFDSMAFSSCPTLTFTGCTVTNASISNVPATSGTLTTSTTAVLNLCTINVSTVTAGNHWWTGADPTSIFTNCAFTGGGGHALQISAAGGSSITLTGNTWTSFGADASTGAALNFTASSGTITVNIVGGGIPTYKSAGATINFVNAKTVKVTAKDANTFSVIESARVLIEADAGGDLPAGESVTISSITTAATVTHAGHGMSNGMSVIIRGANENEYNGTFIITYIDTGSYSYTMLQDPAGSSATGTITATCAILTGDTNASGILQTTTFNYTNSQPITGKVRRATAALGTKYKTGAITGTITASGLDTTVLLINDD